MTEPELIAQLSALGVDTRAVVTMLQQYVNTNGDVTLTLSNGVSYTLQSVPKQAAGFTTQFNAMKLAFTQDFGGAVVAQSITRDAFNVITGVLTTFSTGVTLGHVYTRNGQGQITGIAVTVKDNLGNVVATANKTINRTGSLVTGIS